jgi:hypothetical protein
VNDLLHTRTIQLLAAVAATLLLVLAGCGGDDDDDGGGDGGDEAAETQPQTTPETGTTTTPAPDEEAQTGGDAAAAEQTVREYIDALAAADGAKVCDLLSASEREEADTFAGDEGCAGFFDEFLQIVSVEQRNELRAADPEVEVDGNRGTAKLPSLEGDGEDTVHLRKEGGEWKIGETDSPGEGP